MYNVYVSKILIGQFIYIYIYISTRPDETSKLSKLTECVKNVKDWMTSNFLLLNSDKTEILLIGPKNSTQNLLDHNLLLDGCTVTSSMVKNLGVILDSNLSFKNVFPILQFDNLITFGVQTHSLCLNLD